MQLSGGKEDEATMENCQELLSGYKSSRTELGSLVIPANWIMLRARSPSTAIKISKILFERRIRGWSKQRDGGNILSESEEGEVTWYCLN